MSTDRQLLKMAAKAAGFESIDFLRGDGSVNAYYADGQHSSWDPFNDDGDALRLAVQLKIQIRLLNGKAHAGKHGRYWCTECWLPNGDEYAATRRAIVRAAAEIGRNLP